jgi:hypothetical protein
MTIFRLFFLLSFLLVQNIESSGQNVCGQTYRGYIVQISTGAEKGSFINHVDYFYIDSIPKFNKKKEVNVDTILKRGGVLINYNYFTDKFGAELYESNIFHHYYHYEPVSSQKIGDKHLDFYRVVILGNIKDTTITAYAGIRGHHTSHSHTFFKIDNMLDGLYKILFPEIVIHW